MRIFALTLLTCLGSLQASADTLSVHCPLGCPTSPETNDLVFAHVYALSNNPSTKFADWVAYEVDVLNFGPSPGRKWKSDPLLNKDETLEKDDYDGAHSSDLESDRGHQAPLASFAGSRHWEELNYLSNITPQDKDLNQGPWRMLEDAVRRAVSFRDSLYVITGPIYMQSMMRLPNADEDHRVPSSYFKVIYDDSGKSASFLMHQSADRGDDYCESRITYKALQEILPFELPNLHEREGIAERLGCK